MKWLKRIGIAIGMVLVIVIGALVWLLGTTSGLRFALHEVEGSSDGGIAVESADGRLVGPLALHGVRYRSDSGMLVTIDSVQLDLQPWALLGKRLHLTSLQAHGMTVALPAQPNPQPPEKEAPFSLAPPLAIQIDQAHISALDVTKGDKALVSSGTLDFGALWTADQLALHELSLKAKQGHATLDGTLAIGGSWRGDGQGAFAWTLGERHYAGQLQAHSDGTQMQASVALSAPTDAQLHWQMAQHGDVPWTLKLDVPSFDPRALVDEDAVHALALHLDGHGDRHHANIAGQIKANGTPIAIDPLRVTLSGDGNVLVLDELKLSSQQIAGTLRAHGRIKLAATPLSANLDLRWDNVQFPAKLAGQKLSSHGSLSFRGSAQRFHAEGQASAGPPDAPSTFKLDLDGTPQQITLNTLKLKQPQGQVQAQGTVTLKPALGWQLTAKADNFNPGRLLAGWGGALDFDIATQGTQTASGPRGQLAIHSLSGTLRQRPVRGSGTLSITPDRVVNGHLEIASGDSSLGINAAPGASNDVDVTLAIASLSDFLPKASGSIQGEFTIRGKAPHLSLRGHLNGRDIEWQQRSVERMALSGQVDDISQPSGKLEVTAHGVSVGALALSEVQLHAHGDRASHQLSAAIDSARGEVRLALAGSMQGKAWHGTLSRLDLSPNGLPAWRLRDPAKLQWNDGAFKLTPLCLTAGTPTICLSATRDAKGALAADYQLDALPLALLLTASSTDLPLRIDGTLDGSGHITRSAAGRLGGHAELTSKSGSLTWTDRPKQPALTWHDFDVRAELAGDTQRVAVTARLNDNGSIDAHLTIAGQQEALDGQATLQLPSIAFVGLFSDQLANVNGNLEAQLRFAGTLQQPAIAGRAVIDSFGAEIPAAGIALEHGHIIVSTSGRSPIWHIDGKVHSGKGLLAISGQFAVDPSLPTAIHIGGSEFTAIDIPAAEVVMTPDLDIKRGAEGIHVTGEVKINRADINVAKLPGGGSVGGGASPDIVVVDEKIPEKKAALPLTANVKVDFGQDTHIQGMGINGQISGVLTVIDKPGSATLGQGQITIDGSYHAYGQDLHIENGQLLFASTPIANPGLNIRAVRNLHPNATIESNQVVGLLITGTAQQPVLTVFSNPPMPQSDALSYLITGKPLSQAKGGEGNMVGAAAQALGSAAGGLLAKKIDARVGADVSVASSTALGGASALTIGKYLSPRLYLSYGVGLFQPGEVVTLRYILSKRWNIEAVNATEFSRLMFNYRLEH